MRIQVNNTAQYFISGFIRVQLRNQLGITKKKKKSIKIVTFFRLIYFLSVTKLHADCSAKG